MRVVINACYGGFGLSTKAMVELVKMKSPIIKVMSIKEYSGYNTFEAYKKRNKSYQGEFKKVDGYWVGWIKDVLYKDNNVYILNEDDYKCRSHKDLIAVVQKLGKDANGEHADLKIAQIPSGVNWTIDEYDGVESVEEVHRSWF